jgi:hypothetical protein
VVTFHAVTTEEPSIVALFLYSHLFLSLFSPFCLFLFIFMHFSWSPYSSIALMSRLWPGVQDSIDGTENPSFPPHSNPVNLVCDVYWRISTGKKRPEPEANHLPAYSIEVKNARSHTSTVPNAFKVWWSVKHRDSFIFLGAVAKVRKATLAASHLSVCPSVYMEQLGSQWMDFHEIWYLSIFRKTVEKIQFSLKFDFTVRPVYICDRISLNYSLNEKFFREWL